MSKRIRVISQNLSLVYLYEKDINECISLAIKCFKEFQDHPSHIEQWFNNRIVNNPWQRFLPAIGIGIRDKKGVLIAFRALFAQPWWLNGQSTIIAFCANTAVDINYRGMGFASLLIEESCSFSEITGSTTAGSITQKAYNNLNYSSVGGLDNNFYRLRSSFCESTIKRIGKFSGYYIGKLMDIILILRDLHLKSNISFSLQKVEYCDEEFDKFWLIARKGYGSCLEHSSAYINWRLFDAPTCPLELSSLVNSNGDMKAYAIWHVTEFSGDIRMAVLRDLFCPIDDEISVQAILYLLINEWRASEISWVSIEVASPHLSKIFVRNGYEWVPSHGNRYYIYSQTFLDKNILMNWYRSGLDGDYFDLAF